MLGHIVQQREQAGAMDGNGSSGALSSRKRELRRGHREARREMLDDIGFN